MAAEASALHLQVETPQAAPSPNGESSHLRLTWFFQGIGLAALMLVGVAACGPPDWITYEPPSGSGKLSNQDATAGFFPTVPGVNPGGLRGAQTPAQTAGTEEAALIDPPVLKTTGDMEALSTSQQGSAVPGPACRGTLNFGSSRWSSCAARASVAMQDGGNGWNGQTSDGQSYEVEFTIMQDGRMTYKIQGIKGTGCVAVSENIQQILKEQFGCEAYETKATEEMFEQPVNVEVSEEVDVQVKNDYGSTW